MVYLFFVLTILSSLTAGLGWFLSMRQYFKIKAYKTGKESANIFLEHSVKGQQYVFSGDFIEYFPITYILIKLDNSAYSNYDDELKDLYNQKKKYEMLFWISFFLFIVIPGGSITW